ncbi:MAG TPA: carbon-nitrogen hydrolase family protein [Thermomicrobiales bacterium]|nr:carbon-nitrogen hydrolase family protein [Thermomicrobiales bacterium]
MRIAVLQVNSQADKAHNIAVALDLVGRAAGVGADLAVLPEYVDFLGPDEQARAAAEPIPGPTSAAFAAAAREHGIWLLAGSIREAGDDPGRSYNTSLLFDRAGAQVARYRKIHLYDVELAGNVSARESATIAPGCEIVTAEVEGHPVGLSICYDLRFPELYRAQALRGAEILFVPAAFTLFTGKDHWEVLLRARAIENQCFVVAAGQTGKHEPHAACYGRSMIIDPWGTVLATAPDGVGMALADLDFAHLRRIRAELPSLANRRPEAYPAAERVAVPVAD